MEMGNPLELIQKLRNVELNAALVTGELAEANVTIDYTFTDEIVMLSGNRLSGDEASLLRQRWAVVPARCQFRSKLEQWHKDEGVAFRSFLEIRSLETLLGSVKAGLACTLLSRSVLSGAYEQLYVHPIPEKYRYIETGLVRRHESFTSSSYRVFARLVREEGV